MSLGFVLPDPGLCAWQLYVSWHVLSLASGVECSSGRFRDEKKGEKPGSSGMRGQQRARAGGEHIGERASTGAVPPREGDLRWVVRVCGCLARTLGSACFAVVDSLPHFPCVVLSGAFFGGKSKGDESKGKKDKGGK